MDLPIVAGVEFRPVVGFEGYAVGDDGSVWGCRKSGNGYGGFRKWRKLIPVPMQNGYVQVFLRQNGRTVKRLVHEVVLSTFVRPSISGEECCHFPDKTRSNNSLRNLRWDTHKGNDNDKSLQGTKLFGDTHHNSKLTSESVAEIRKSFSSKTLSGWARHFGVSRATIRDAAKGKTWKHVSSSLA